MDDLEQMVLSRMTDLAYKIGLEEYPFDKWEDRKSAQEYRIRIGMEKIEKFLLDGVKP